ncbi:MAG: CapA family protein [Alphaproteobacteria bacterium]|nr:CapA family protein [Alphaproteobacteria bacterium]
MMDSVKIFFAGDFCSKPSTSKITVSDDLKELIRSCDLKVVNFEVPLKPNVTLPIQKRERFFQHDDTPEFLRGLGFNLFSMANNHAFDWGDEGFKKTKAALGDEAFGAGTYDESYQVKIIEMGGMKIGFFALSFAAYKGVFDDVTHHEGLGCAYINDLRVNHDIIEAKKNVDYLFILPHDGIEYIDVPMPETIARYRDFIDYGADGVIGTHPHCPQGWEEYKGKPIFYSLGNFLFNSKEGYDYRATNRPHWYEGLCVIITISEGKLVWEVVNTRNVDNIELVVDHDSARDKHIVYLCNLLHDQLSYNQVLEKECHRLAERQEIPIVDHSFHDYGLKQTCKLLARYVVNYLKKKPRGDDRELRYLLKNDARRKVLERGLSIK